MRQAVALVLAIILDLPASAPAQTVESKAAEQDSCGPGAAEVKTIAGIVDGATLSLEGGEMAFLSGIDVPRGAVANPRDGSGAAEAARRQLERLLGGGAVMLRLDDQGQRDRHGRLLAQIFDTDGAWLQEAMVASGYARVRPFPGASACTDRLLERERAARAAGSGLWRREFALLSANDPSLVDRKGLYVLVEGRVVSVGRGNHVDFLNFGHYWRRDFTVLVGAAMAARLAEAGLEVGTLATRRVRVRGVIEDNGGPAMRLNDPREIEVLDDG